MQHSATIRKKLARNTSRPNRPHFCARLQPIQIVNPRLHHRDPVVDEPGAILFTTERVGHPMRQLVLDNFGRKPEPFVNDGPSRGPKSVAGDLGFPVEAQPLQRGIDGRSAHRVSAIPTCRDATPFSRQRLQLFQDIYRRCGQWCQMLHVRLGNGIASFAAFQIYLRPLSLPQFTGSYEQQRRKLCSAVRTTSVPEKVSKARSISPTFLGSVIEAKWVCRWAAARHVNRRSHRALRARSRRRSERSGRSSAEAGVRFCERPASRHGAALRAA
ncbi:hypothetical protein [Caballeronia sp. BCC1704]|uniref:hypothetical protein n=1 Tax=Caballeronia sp. BCC1704 TaxID=2676300 RepID=UPI003264F05B